MPNFFNQSSQFKLTRHLSVGSLKFSFTKAVLILSITVLLIGCSNPNGTYIIYSAEARTLPFGGEDGFDYDASELLCQKMLGKRFQMEYNPDFVIMKDGAPEVVLQKMIDGTDTSYVNVRQDGDKTIEYKLYMKPKRESNTLMATAKWITNGIDSVGNSYQRVGKIARASCKIKKYEKN